MKIARLVAISCVFSCFLLTPALSENSCNESMRDQTKLGVVWNPLDGPNPREWFVICRASWGERYWYYVTQYSVERNHGQLVYGTQYNDRFLSRGTQFPRNPDPCSETTPRECIQICPKGGGLPGCPE